MGIDGWPDILNDLLSKPVVQGAVWYANYGPKPYHDLPSPRSVQASGKPKRLARIYDGPGFLYKRWMGEEKRYSVTVGDLADTIIEKLKPSMDMPEVGLLMLLFDRKTPIIKTVTRKDGGQTPKTPFELLSADFVGTEEQRADAAWRLKMSQQRSMSDGSTLRLSGSNQNDPSCFVLPKSLPTAASNVTRPPDYYYYEEHLANRHFKTWLVKEVCRIVLARIRVPEGKLFVISGPDICAQKTSLGIEVPEPRFQHRYWEVDNSVGYWAAQLGDPEQGEAFDVDIDSEDGDVIISALLGSHLRRTHNESVEDIRFCNNLRLIRNNWKSTDTTVYNINNLYITLQYWSSCIGQDGGFVIENPIGNFALVAMASGCDFVRSNDLLPNVGAKTLISTYFACASIFAVDLVSDYTADAAHVTVHPDSFARFISCCYQRARATSAMKLPGNNIPALCRILREKDSRKPSEQRPVVKPYPTPATLRVLCANLAWTLSYFASGAVGNDTSLPDGLTKIDGLPIHGYALDSEGANACGFTVVSLSSDANAGYMLRKHTEKPAYDPEEWQNAKLEGIQSDGSEVQ